MSKLIDIYIRKYEEALETILKLELWLLSSPREKWKKYLEYRHGKNPKCEVCGKELGFMTGHRRDTVCFDRRHGEGRFMKGTPSLFFKGSPDAHKIVVFEREDFGILCNRCNLSLPSDLEERRKLAGKEKFAKYILKPDKRW